MKNTFSIIMEVLIATLLFFLPNSVNVFANEDIEIRVELSEDEPASDNESDIDIVDELEYNDEITLSEFEPNGIELDTSGTDASEDGWTYDLGTQTATVTKDFVTLPDNIRSEVKKVIYEGDAKGVCSYAWQGCEKLESVILSDKVSEIGDYAFNGCTNLKSIELPDGFRIIKRFAFKNSGITSIELPDSIVLIEESVFLGCADLKTADLSEITLDKVSFSLFASCENLEKVILPDGIKIIYAKAFYECKKLKEINMPANLVKIDGNAFAGCENLEEVELPDGLTVCGESIFSECTHLKKVTFPDNEEFTSISNKMFYNCSSLGNTEEGLTIPESVTSIADYAFYGCSSLGITTEKNSEDSDDTDDEDTEEDDDEEVTTWEVVIPDSVTRIGQLAFSHCDGMENIILPDNPEFTILNQETFSYCTNLKSIRIPDTVEQISARVFYECPGLESVELPQNSKYTAVNNNLFENCTGLKNIEIPENINTIGYAAFMGSGLEDLVIPDTIVVISTNAFKNCTSLEKIIIPDSVTTLGTKAFYGCDKLKKIYGGRNIRELSQGVFFCSKMTKTYLECKNIGRFETYYWLNDNREIDNTYEFTYFSKYLNKLNEDETEVLKESDKKEDYERTYHFEFDEKWFANDNSKANYNHELTKASMCMALACEDFPNDAETGYRATEHIEELFENMGVKAPWFEYPKPNYSIDGTADTIGTAIGYKTIGNENLLVVVVRSAGYQREWGGNFNVFQEAPCANKEYDHYGFRVAAEEVLNRIDSYLYSNHLDENNVKYWIAGYSRGAAVANYVSARLIDGRYPDCCKLSLEEDHKGKVYGFCFETPRNTEDASAHDQKYEDGIVNVINPIDIVTMVAMNNEKNPVAHNVSSLMQGGLWKFKRYGREYFIPSYRSTKYYNANYLRNVHSFMKNELGIEQELPYEDNMTEYVRICAIQAIACAMTPKMCWASQHKIQKLLVDYIKNLSGANAEKYSTLGLFNDLFGVVSQDRVQMTELLTEKERKAGARDHFMGSHFEDLNFAWVNFLSEEELTRDKWSIYNFFNCPVDVTIYDSDNNVVGKIINDEPIDDLENGIMSNVDVNGQKVFITPGDGNYHAEIVATGDGEMTYTIQAMKLGSDGVDRVVSFADIPISKGDVLLANIGEVNTETGEAAYSLMMCDKEIEPTVDQSGDDVESFFVQANIEGKGMVLGEGFYTYGEFTKLRAIPDEGYVFREWQVDGKTYSTDKEFRYEIKENFEITAIFDNNVDSSSEKLRKMNLIIRNTVM